MLEWLQIAGDSSTVIGHPTVSNDESTIYFSADLPGGFGGKDIWMVTRTGKEKGNAVQPAGKPRSGDQYRRR